MGKHTLPSNAQDRRGIPFRGLGCSARHSLAAFTWTHLFRIDFYAEQKMIMYTPHSEYNYLFGIDSMPNRRGGVVRFNRHVYTHSE